MDRLFFQGELTRWQSSVTRFREFYIYAFDLSYAALLIGGWIAALFVGYKLISKRSLQLTNLIVFCFGLTSFLVFSTLFLFYLYFHAITSRYLVDFSPAFQFSLFALTLSFIGIFKNLKFAQCVSCPNVRNGSETTELPLGSDKKRPRWFFVMLEKICPNCLKIVSKFEEPISCLCKLIRLGYAPTVLIVLCGGLVWWTRYQLSMQRTVYPPIKPLTADELSYKLDNISKRGGLVPDRYFCHRGDLSSAWLVDGWDMKSSCMTNVHTQLFIRTGRCVVIEAIHGQIPTLRCLPESVKYNHVFLEKVSVDLPISGEVYCIPKDVNLRVPYPAYLLSIAWIKGRLVGKVSSNCRLLNVRTFTPRDAP